MAPEMFQFPDRLVRFVEDVANAARDTIDRILGLFPIHRIIEELTRRSTLWDDESVVYGPLNRRALHLAEPIRATQYLRPRRVGRACGSSYMVML